MKCQRSRQCSPTTQPMRHAAFSYRPFQGASPSARQEVIAVIPSQAKAVLEHYALASQQVSPLNPPIPHPRHSHRTLACRQSTSPLKPSSSATMRGRRYSGAMNLQAAAAAIAAAAVEFVGLLQQKNLPCWLAATQWMRKVGERRNALSLPGLQQAHKQLHAPWPAHPRRHGEKKHFCNKDDNRRRTQHTHSGWQCLKSTALATSVEA